MRYLSIIAITMASCLGCLAQSKHTTFYDQRATLFEFLPVDSTSIVFVGNSLTNGCEWHELLGMPNVLNRGISGDIVEGVSDRIQSVLDGNPAKIVLMTGVNDVSHHLTADSIATSFIALIDRMTEASPQTKIYVQSLLPYNASFEMFKSLVGEEQTIRDVNALLQPQIEARGLTWIDLYSHFADENGNLREDLTNDGLHLLGSGYLLWRDIVLPYVKE